MERYNLGVVLVSLMPPSPAVLLADLQWTSSDEHTCSHMEMTLPYGYAGSLRGTCPASTQTSNWHRETQISSLEFSPSCHHVARWNKAWCLYTCGFIPKKIQWHIHAGSWSLVNCLAGSLYEALYKVLMNINESGCQPYGWPRPWWWSVYPCDTPTLLYLKNTWLRTMYCLQIIWWESRGFQWRSFHVERTWFKLAVTSSNQFLPVVAHDKWTV